MLTTSFPRREGDYSGSFVFGLARELVRLGYEIVVVAPHDAETPGAEKMDGVQVRRFSYFLPRKLQALCYGSGIPSNLRQRPWVILQVPFLLLGFFFVSWQESRGCDLIHAHWSLAGLAGLIVARLRRIPFVLTMHGAEVFARRGTMLTRFVLDRADHLITNSTFTLTRILEIANPRTYSVIPSGVNPEKSDPASPQAIALVREKWSVHEDDPTLLFVGRLVERKGVDVLIAALPNVIARHPELRLLIVGVGPMKEPLTTQAEELHVAQRITFTGFVPEEELRALYQIVTAFVLPAVYDPGGDTEGLGVVLLEAMLNGCPVIASRVGGITDVIPGGEVGLLVEPQDPAQLSAAILCLLDDPLLRQRLSEKGQWRARTDFSWERICEQTIRTYQGVQTKRRSRST